MEKNKKEIFDFLNSKYSLKQFDSLDNFKCEEFMCWAFYKPYNLFNSNNKIIEFKSAFGNLGINLKGCKVEKNIIKNTNTDIFYLDFVKIDDLEILKNIFENTHFGKKTGFIFSKKETANFEQEKTIIIKTIKRYFNTDYKLYSKDHLKLIDSFLEKITSLESSVIFQIRDLMEYPYILEINNIKRFQDCSEKLKFNNDYVYRYSFPKPYKDFFSWKGMSLNEGTKEK